MKITAVPKYLTPYGVVEFAPVPQALWVPTGTHPNEKTAKFFMQVHRAIKEGKDRYYNTDNNLDPPLPQR